MRGVHPFLLLAAAVLAGCDIVREPKVEGPVTPPPGGTVLRKVLLEECTGFRCNNCPDAAETAQALHGIYGDALVLVGVHMVTSFAAPLEPLGDGEFDTDFRVPAGEEYRSTLGNFNALPVGFVNRRRTNSSYRVAKASWSSAVAQMINTPADLDLWFENVQLDAAARTVSGTVRVACLHEVTTPLNLTLYLTEDHVLDWQLDNRLTPPEISDYDHRHVLRGALNGTWGQVLTSGTMAVGDTVTTPFSYALPANVLEPNNCALVTYAYSTAGADQYEVKQVEQFELAP